MVVHEIVGIRKGAFPETKTVELNVVKNEWTPSDGPRIAATIHVEHTRDGLEEMFGAGYDVGDKVEMVELRFSAAEGE